MAVPACLNTLELSNQNFKMLRAKLDQVVLFAAQIDRVRVGVGRHSAELTLIEKWANGHLVRLHDGLGVAFIDGFVPHVPDAIVQNPVSRAKVPPPVRALSSYHFSHAAGRIEECVQVVAELALRRFLRSLLQIVVLFEFGQEVFGLAPFIPDQLNARCFSSLPSSHVFGPARILLLR